MLWPFFFLPTQSSIPHGNASPPNVHIIKILSPDGISLGSTELLFLVIPEAQDGAQGFIVFMAYLAYVVLEAFHFGQSRRYGNWSGVTLFEIAYCLFLQVSRVGVLFITVW